MPDRSSIDSMDRDALFARYRLLQSYVGWTDEDARCVRLVAPELKKSFSSLIEDFYAEIQKHAETRSVIRGGEAQIERLKRTLYQWLEELLTGPYDSDYVFRRWRVGWRHVEIGLDQTFTVAAMARLRQGLLHALAELPDTQKYDRRRAARALNKLIDLDLAVIEIAYQQEHDFRVRQESEVTFRTLVEMARCLILIVRPDDTIRYASPGAWEIVGEPPDDLKDKAFTRTLLPKAYRQQVREIFEASIAGEPTHSFETPLIRKDGSVRWMLWNVRHVPNYRGEAALIVLGQDITHVREMRERALHAERLAAIGRMVAGLAHESGNALARSQACLEMLSFEVEDRPEALKLIERIQKAQDHLKQLYDDVRGYAAPMKLECEEWDLRGIWRQAWENLEATRRGRDVDLIEECDLEDCTCYVDNFRLEQVFRNIFENALAACQDPVEIRVSCEECTLHDVPAVRVRIRDNGPGLNEEQREKIFDPFFTTKTKGTGLGMAIAQRVIHAHQGEISVGGEPGQGAEIILVLPRKPTPKAMGEGADPDMAHSSSAGR